MASRTGWLTVWAVLASSGPALGSSLGVELGGTAGQSTELSTSAGTLLARAMSDIDLAEQVALHLDFAYTRALAQGPPPGLTIGSSGGNVFSLAAGVDLAVLDNALLSFELNFSPSSTVEQQVVALIGPTTFTPVVSSRSDAFGGTLAFAISTGFERDVEATFDGVLAVTNFHSVQQIVDRSGNPIPPSECLKAPAGYRALCVLLFAEHGTAFTESRLATGATVTLFRDTDLALSGAYYFYSDDPTQVGFFALATGGRLPANLGDPIPLVPYLWSLRPGITQRFGPAVSLGAYYEFADAYANEGTSHLFGLRLGVRVSRKARLVLRLEGQSFTDSAGVSSLAGSAVLSTRIEL